MSSKNSEAQQCVNTNRASMSETVCKETNMNIVAKSVYNFHGVNLIPVKDVAGIWLTSADIAKALGYKSTKSISNLFTQYEDEFSQGMTMVIESVTNGINGSTRRMKVRVFSLRGAHLIAMFARTPVAKEFRRWVLDILDREVADKPESSPLNRFHTKVTVMDNIFGGEIEFYGKAEDLNAIASGICRTLGFEPSGFKQIPMDTKRIRKIH